MYLKGMEVSGFKSFARKTEFVFEDGITAIVGPNGSGKSNIADAMRWVLGEQSAKQLRSTSMQDVIFAGTENRRAQGAAYVNMIFDNSDHALPLDFDEVTIGRRVYRSGESEYLINSSTCRLKDIQELFYDTGVGKEGYSIIGQGQIDKVLSGKPEDRREMFDEAAGIVKYKKRKNQAMSRLAKEEESLVRIEDILRELEGQEKPLYNQAEKAKKYLKLHDELRIQEVNDFLMEQSESTVLLDNVIRDSQDVNVQLEEARTHAAEIETRYEAINEESAVLEENLRKLRVDHNAHKDEMSALRSEAEVLTTQIKADESMLSLHENQEAELRKAMETKDQNYENVRFEYEEVQASCRDLEEEGKEILQEINQISQNIDNCERELSEERNREAKIMERRSVYRVNAEKFETIAQQREQQKASLQGKLLEAKAIKAQLKDQIKEKTEAANRLTAQIQQAGDAQKKKNDEINDIRKKGSEAAYTARQKARELEQLQARFSSLQNIAERYEGFGGAVKSLMGVRNQFPGIKGVLADLIHVEAAHETAVETALGGAMQNIVADNERTTSACIEYLKRNKAGRATFLPITTVKPRGSFNEKSAFNMEGVIGTCDSLVRTDPEYMDIIRNLLGRILVVDNMPHALTVAKKYRYSFRIVTLDGESLNSGGSISGGAFKNKSTLLGRRRELEELEKEIGIRSAANERAQSELVILENELDKARDAFLSLREELHRLQLEFSQEDMKLNQAKEALEDLKEEEKSLKKDMELLNTEQTDTRKDQKSVEKNAAEVETEMEKCKAQIRYLTVTLEDYRESLKTATEESTDNQIELAAKQTSLTHLQEDLARMEKRQKDREEQVEALSLERTRLGKELEERYARLNVCNSSAGELEKLVEEEDKSIVLLEEKKNSMQKEQQTLFQEQKDYGDQVTDLEKESIRLDNKKINLEQSIDGKASHLWEEYELTPSNAEKFRLDPMPPRQEMLIRIQELKAAIRKLGNINPNAVEEYAALAERLGFMRTQHDDLVHARENLQLLINQLNTSMEKQFKEKFKDIQTEFNKVFKELFGGGTGTLELLDDADELEAGIVINVQPPGKKLQNMMALSGGEKALTAISLLFAILNLKPSPFCMLDEIEAALDDANVDRYAAYLGKLKMDTQFIVITHRRGTMLIADQLYGITMQEKGVSSLVSVDLTDANEE